MSAPSIKKLSQTFRINTEAFSFRIFQMIRTFLLLCISRILTKAPDLSAAGRMIKAMFTKFDISFFICAEPQMYNYGVDQKGLFVVFLAILVLLVVGVLQECGMKIRETLSKQNILFRWAIIWLLLVAVIVFGQYGPGYNASSFIYGGY